MLELGMEISSEITTYVETFVWTGAFLENLGSASTRRDWINGLRDGRGLRRGIGVSRKLGKFWKDLTLILNL